jgi:hypothetical protein
VKLVVVSITNEPDAMSRTATSYEVAPVDAPQLSVTVLLDWTGPGLLVEPGLVLVGVAGAACAIGKLTKRKSKRLKKAHNFLRDSTLFWPGFALRRLSLDFGSFIVEAFSERYQLARGIASVLDVRRP